MMATENGTAPGSSSSLTTTTSSNSSAGMSLSGMRNSLSSMSLQQQHQQHYQHHHPTPPPPPPHDAGGGGGGHGHTNSMTSSVSTTTMAPAPPPPSSMPLDSSVSPYPSTQQQQPHYSQQQVVPPAFEEGTLRALCDLDCGFPLLMDRIKQSMASCRETSVFLKKRAQMEEEYGRSMQKLARERMDSYSLSEGKAGSFVGAYNAMQRTHEVLADNRIRLGGQLHEMAEQLVELGKEVERNRKVNKELGTRLERNLVDSESLTEKCKTRFDQAVEELERILLSKAGENAKDNANLPHEVSSTTSSGGASKRTLGKAIGKLKGGPKNPAQLQKLEEEARSKMNSMSDAYRQQVIATQTIRQEYFNLQLPRMLKSMKESLDEIDLATQYHLSRYAFLYENLLLNDALTVSPPSAQNFGTNPAGDDMPSNITNNGLHPPGLKHIVENIDNREDFRSYMQNYAVTFAASGQKTLRREGPPEEGFVRMAKAPTSAQNGLGLSNSNSNSPYAPYSHPPSSNNTQYTSGQQHNAASSSSSTPYQPQVGPLDRQQHGPMYFGVDLGYQMARDGVDVPKVLEKCAEVIEMYGLDITGLYRLSGTTSRIQRLKAKLEQDIDSVNLHSDENLTDINDISGVLKLFFRELPEPLFTHELYHGFIEAARIENARLRHIRLHERINELPDPNYATCKYFLGHLDKVRSHEATNSMSVSNLAIVFGPTLLGPPPEDSMAVLQDMQWQCKAIETILEHYAEIFVDAEEEAESGEAVPSAPSAPPPQQHSDTASSTSGHQSYRATGLGLEDAVGTAGYATSSMEGHSGDHLYPQSYETASNLSISPGSVPLH